MSRVGLGLGAGTKILLVKVGVCTLISCVRVGELEQVLKFHE